MWAELHQLTVTQKESILVGLFNNQMRPLKEGLEVTDGRSQRDSKQQRHSSVGLDEANCHGRERAMWLGMMGGLLKMMASVLQLQGSEFCQQPVSSKVDPEPQMRITALADIWISASKTLSKEPSYAMPRLLTCGPCEMITACCVKLLSLW